MKPTDLTEVLKDEFGATGYIIHSDGSYEVYLSDGNGTYYCRFASLDILLAWARGLRRITGNSEEK